MNQIFYENLKKDAEILYKYITNKNYMEKIYIATKIVTSLEINDKITYYKYQNEIKLLKGINYKEATLIIRIKDKNYYNTLLKFIPTLSCNQEDSKKECKIFYLKKR